MVSSHLSTHSYTYSILYTASLSTVIKKLSVLHHSYADDSQLQRTAASHQMQDLVLSMQKCIDDIETWITVNKLKLSDNKTEAMIASSGRKSRSLSSPFPNSMSMTTGSACVPMSNYVKNLGVTPDCHLTMKTHISNLVCSAKKRCWNVLYTSRAASMAHKTVVHCLSLYFQNLPAALMWKKRCWDVLCT